MTTKIDLGDIHWNIEQKQPSYEVLTPENIEIWAKKYQNMLKKVQDLAIVAKCVPIVLLSLNSHMIQVI